MPTSESAGLNTSRPKLSVVIPTYRRGASLAKLLNALRAQTLPEIEILVMDQNPEGWLASQLGPGGFDGVEHHHLAEPNVSTARNVGALKAKAETLFFVDDDLLPERAFCAHGVASVNRFLDATCVVPVLRPNGRSLPDSLGDYQRLKEKHHFLDDALWQIPACMSAAIFFTRKGFLATGGFDAGLFDFAKAGEDTELFRRMHARGMAVWCDTTFGLVHDEKVPGGCGARQISLEQNRERSIRGMAYKAWAHSSSGGERMNLRQTAYLLRNNLLNRRALTQGVPKTASELVFLARALVESRAAIRRNASRYSEIDAISHLEGQ